jgi:hypothetical protein
MAAKVHRSIQFHDFAMATFPERFGQIMTV